MTKFELIIIRYEDGMPKPKYRTETNTISSLSDRFGDLIEQIQKDIDEEEAERHNRVAEDDDIPF